MAGVESSAGDQDTAEVPEWQENQQGIIEAKRRRNVAELINKVSGHLLEIERTRSTTEYIIESIVSSLSSANHVNLTNPLVEALDRGNMTFECMATTENFSIMSQKDITVLEQNITAEWNWLLQFKFQRYEKQNNLWLNAERDIGLVHFTVTIVDWLKESILAELSRIRDII